MIAVAADVDEVRNRTRRTLHEGTNHPRSMEPMRVAESAMKTSTV